MKNIIDSAHFYLKKLLLISLVGYGIFQICYKQSIAWDIMHATSSVLANSTNSSGLLGFSVLANGIAHLSSYFCWLTLMNIDTTKHRLINCFLLISITISLISLAIYQVFNINSFLWIMIREGIFKMVCDDFSVFLLTVFLFANIIILIPLSIFQMLIVASVNSVKKYRHKCED